MDQKIPFTTYDFWAYLSSGFLFLFAVDQVTDFKFLMRENWTVVQGVIVVSVAYVVGQLIASASSTIFEKILVGRCLGYPRDILFGKFVAWSWVRSLMPSYFSPLPGLTQKSVLEKGLKVGVDKPGEALFWPAHVYGRSTPAVAARLDNFLNLYGFCRNVALVGFLDAAIFYWAYMQPSGSSEHLFWARCALVIGFGMTFRYLKFYRHFSIEVFTSYAFSKEKEPESKS